MFGLIPELEIDVPFKHRHHCWFCGEPSRNAFTFPHDGYLVLACPHPKLIVPACTECVNFAIKAQVNSIWQVSSFVKQQLIHYYRKDLAIGLNWTKEELAASEFEHGNFSGFQKSAWFMYEVAKGRVNFLSWPISYHGALLERTEDKEPFTFDGMTYPSIDDAIEHYSLTFDIKAIHLKQAVAKVGDARFAYAVRYCRVLKGATPQEMKAALLDLE